jgi:hypothetical protein
MGKWCSSWNMILSILNEIDTIYFMVRISIRSAYHLGKELQQQNS